MPQKRLQYGATAKLLHWIVVALLVVQYPIGWLMPDIHGSMQPGNAMILHLSLGLTIMAIVLVRLLWRITHPVAPESSLPRWQRATSEGVHWLLYLAVLATTITGWIFASYRGWSVKYFFIIPLPMLASKSSAGVRALDGWHQAAEWTLLALVLVHVGAALVHIFVYRDRIMQRMLWN